MKTVSGLGAAGLIGLVLLVPGLLPEPARGVVPWLACLTLAVGVAAVRDPVLRVLLAGLAVAVVAGWRHAPVPTDAVPHLGGVAAGVLALVTLEIWARDRVRLALALVIVVALGAAAVLVGLRSTTAPGDKGVPMVLSQIDNPPSLPLATAFGQPYVNPNALGMAALMVLCLAGAAAAAPRPPARWHRALRLCGVGAVAVALGAMVVTQSRGVALACVGAGLLVLWFRRPQWRRMAAGASLLVILGVGVVLQRDADVRTATRASAQERWAQWQRAGELVVDAPWRGIGLDAYRRIAPVQVHAHNMALQTALDLGLAGLCVYVGVMGWLLHRVVRCVRAPGDPFRQMVASGAGLALVAVHVYGVFDAVALGTRIGTLQWVAGGLVLAAAQETSEASWP